MHGCAGLAGSTGSQAPWSANHKAREELVHDAGSFPAHGAKWTQWGWRTLLARCWVGPGTCMGVAPLPCCDLALPPGPTRGVTWASREPLTGVQASG